MSPKQFMSQPIANKNIVGGKISMRIVRFRIRKFLCVLNVMPGVYFRDVDIRLVKHCGATKQPTIGIYVEN